MRIADLFDMDSDRVGGYQFVLTELYRTEQGLRHHGRKLLCLLLLLRKWLNEDSQLTFVLVGVLFTVFGIKPSGEV